MIRQSGETLLLIGVIYATVLTFTLKAGVVGVVGGRIDRRECSSGYWIVVAALTTACVAILALAWLS